MQTKSIRNGEQIMDVVEIKENVRQVLELDEQIAKLSRNAMMPTTNLRDKAKAITQMSEMMETRVKLLKEIIEDDYIV